MGFYHTLQLADGTDIGGYSKGGSKDHWLFAFAPENFEHTVEEAVLVTEIHQKFIGYVTTVGEALHRLGNTYRVLEKLGETFRRHEDAKIMSQWKQDIEYLSRKLRPLRKHETLILNQTDGFEYACIVGENYQVTGYQSYAFQNEVEDIWKQVRAIEERTLTFEEWLQMTIDSFTDAPVPYFYGEVAHYIAHEERSYGPNPVTEWFDKQPDDFANSTKAMFVYFCEKWPTYEKEEGLSVAFTSPSDPYVIMDVLLYEVCETLKKYNIMS